MPDPFLDSPANAATARRDFLAVAGALGTSLALPQSVRGGLAQLTQPVRLGLIADLHHDVMHDGPRRLQAFLKSMAKQKPDALIQLGDFAYPNTENQPVADAFRNAHPRALHVLGNHEIDDGHSFDEVAKIWGMPARYYTESIEGLNLIVLDGNEKPPNHQGGYPARIGPEQMNWLRSQLHELSGPVIVICHQPLAGPSAIDNAKDVQEILNQSADKVLLTVNGHTHIDHVVRVGRIINLHVNSASYYWVGGSHRNRSFTEAIHTKFPYVEYTCPYQDSLFTTLTIDPKSGRIHVAESETQWVGKSPAELGVNTPADLTDGEEICPQIRQRSLLRPPG